MWVIPGVWVVLIVCMFLGGNAHVLYRHNARIKKGCPTVVFEVVASHTTKVLHISDMFWGCCSDALIVKYDEAVHEVMDGNYSTSPFEIFDTDGNKIVDHGMLNCVCYYFLIHAF